MRICIRQYSEADIPSMILIWNEIVEEGNAFPHKDCLTEETGCGFSVNRRIVLLRKMLKAGKYAVYISFIRIMWEDAGISAIVMPHPCSPLVVLKKQLSQIGICRK